MQPLKESQTQSDAMRHLEEFPRQAAEAFRSYFVDADIEQYQNFLAMMYHYTLDSENKLQFAADQSGSSDLRDYFLQMKREETNHYALAKADYEAFGRPLDTANKPAVVQAFDDFWYALGKESPAEFAAALFVFESIADYVRDTITSTLLRLGVTGKQGRWLRVHVVADEAHGDEAHVICSRYIVANEQPMLSAAAAAVERWTAVFREALK